MHWTPVVREAQEGKRKRWALRTRERQPWRKSEQKAARRGLQCRRPVDRAPEEPWARPPRPGQLIALPCRPQSAQTEGPQAWLSDRCLGERPHVTGSRDQKQSQRNAAPATWMKMKYTLGKMCVTEAERANPGSGDLGLLRRGRTGRWKDQTSAGVAPRPQERA